MKKNKLVLFSAILGMSLSMATGTIGAFADTGDGNPSEAGAIVQAPSDQKNIPVTLHKKQFAPGDDLLDPLTPNTGNILTNGIGAADGLNGVEFTAYNVTAEYYTKLAKTGVTVDAALAHVQGLTPDSTTKVGAAVITETVDGEDGIAKFNLPLYQQVGTEYKYAVYVFVEKVAEGADNIESAVAANLAVAFPIRNLEDVDEDGVGTVHLYPKNVINERSITVKKVATDTRAENALDGVIFNVKKGDNYYKSYDESSQSVIWSDNSADAKPFTISNGQVTIGGLTSGNYTLVETAATGIFEMTEQSQNITFSIDESGDIVTTDTINNVVEDGNTVGQPTDIVDLEHEAEENTIVVENRTLVDMTIEKIEEGTGNKISGAEFKIAKELGGDDYLYVKSDPVPGDGKYDYKWASEFTDDDTTGYEEVVLNGNTKKSVNGLLAGTYYVHEVTPPKGFILPTGNAAYTAIKLYTGTAADKNRVGINLSKKIENLRQGALPSTGSSGIVIFLTMGSALMGGAIIMYRRNRKEAEEI